MRHIPDPLCQNDLSQKCKCHCKLCFLIKQALCKHGRLCPGHLNSPIFNYCFLRKMSLVQYPPPAKPFICSWQWGYRGYIFGVDIKHLFNKAAQACHFKCCKPVQICAQHYVSQHWKQIWWRGEGGCKSAVTNSNWSVFFPIAYCMGH